MYVIYKLTNCKGNVRQRKWKLHYLFNSRASLKQGLWEGGSGGTSVRGCESVNGPQSSLVCLEKVLLEALHWRIQRSRYQPNLIKEISLTQLAGYVVLKLQRFLSVEERIYFIYIKHIFQINVGVFIAFLCY
jgi:hypothetical protein